MPGQTRATDAMPLMQPPLHAVGWPAQGKEGRKDIFTELPIDESPIGTWSPNGILIPMPDLDWNNSEELLWACLGQERGDNLLC